MIDDAPKKISDQLESQESVLYAKNQRLSFLVFGALCLAAAVVFAVWDPLTTDSSWFWFVAGPLAGFFIVLNSHKTFVGHGNDTNPGPYMGIFLGSVAGCFAVSASIQQAWVVPAALMAVAVILLFLAWFEQSGVGMTVAVVIALLTVATAASTLAESAVPVTAMFGLLLISAAVALHSDMQVVVSAKPAKN